MPALVPSTTRAVVFDAYGTLFDVHSAVMRHAGQIGPDARALSELWRAKQLEYSWVRSLIGRYQDFWSLTEAALEHSLARFPQVDASVRASLLDAYRSLSAYPEVTAVLSALRQRGLKTAILSNGSPAMLDSAVAAAGIGNLLDAVLSVHGLACFKPPPLAYTPVEAALGVKPADVLFVSSNRWDVAGAAAFGFTCLWVNRAAMPDEYEDMPPAAVVKDLNALL